MKNIALAQFTSQKMCHYLLTHVIPNPFDFMVTLYFKDQFSRNKFLIRMYITSVLVFYYYL